MVAWRRSREGEMGESTDGKAAFFVGMCRKIFIGGLSYETTDGEFAVV